MLIVTLRDGREAVLVGGDQSGAFMFREKKECTPFRASLEDIVTLRGPRHGLTRLEDTVASLWFRHRLHGGVTSC